MDIRKAVEGDLDKIMLIYERARVFMRENGNPRQWSNTNYPSKELIVNDIRTEHCYVCENNGNICGVFFYTFGYDAEPLYSKFKGIIGNTPYGVVHRIASDGSVKGIGRFCLNFAVSESKTLMIDTHPDNKIMQGLLSSLGFIYVGDINIPDDSDIRMTYITSVKES